MKERIETVTGVLDGVGGADPYQPEAEIISPKTDEKITCIVTNSMARHLGQKLFKKITIRGFWRGDSFIVIELKEGKS